MAQASWFEHRRLIQNVVVIAGSLARNFYIKPSQWRSNQRQTEHLLSLAVVLAPYLPPKVLLELAARLPAKVSLPGLWLFYGSDHLWFG